MLNICLTIFFLVYPEGDAATEIIKLKDKVIKVGKGEGTVVDIIDIADILTGGSAK